MKIDSGMQRVIDALNMITAGEAFTFSGFVSVIQQVPTILLEMNVRNNALEGTNGRQAGIISNAQAEAVSLRSTIDHLKGMLQAEERGARVLREKFGARAEETFPEFVVRLAHERDAAKMKVEGLQAMNDEQACTIEQLQAARDQVGVILGEVRGERDALSLAVGKVALRANATKVELTTLKSALDKMTRRSDDAENRILAKNAELDALEAELTTLKSAGAPKGITIAEMSRQAYETAREKGWHEDDDKPVSEVKKYICTEGLRISVLCDIVEKHRKGEVIAPHEYFEMFRSDSPLELSEDQVRLISDLTLVVTEVAEAIEDVIRGNYQECSSYETDVSKPAKPTGLPSELADVVIRVGHICSRYGIDLEGATRRKLEFNKTRPHKHGKKA